MPASEILKCDPVVLWGSLWRTSFGWMEMCRVFVYGQVLNLADVTRCVFYPVVPVDVSQFLVEIGLI